MSDEERAKWYFDIGEHTENVKEASVDNPLDMTGMAVATREDVAAGRSDFHFDLMFGEENNMRTGIESFTQNMVVGIIDEADSFSADGMDANEMASLEGETRQLILDNSPVPEVNDVTVQESDRQFENEVHISMDVETDYAQYTTECFIGNKAVLDGT